ncbi:MAG: xanthine dehydrogenase family protein molybdopterin-binding subunit [Acidobacteriota bacterium]|nr:xanthine dehydrogenase family protein molybdopterin-binding subunit [Acidobacteriota bacterium]
MPDSVKPDYAWPPMDQRRQIGKPISRLDGHLKASGRAKYASDFNRKDMLFAAMLTSPYANARITKIDTADAKAVPGVAAVSVISPAGTQVQWEGTEIAVVSASTEEIARDAVRKIKVEYQVMPHLVKEDDLAKAGARAKAAGEQVTGDPDQVFKDGSLTVSEGMYAIPVLTHCCLEPHGQVIEWTDAQMNVWPSTQNVSGYGNDLGTTVKFPADKIHVHMDNIGGGFGSKFSPDRWGAEGAKLSQASGGKPVKWMLERATELQIAGNRPSAFAKIKVAAKPDGTLVAWQSESWATGGIGGGGSPPIPYVFTEIPNKRMNHSAVSTNTGGVRAWRAPNHPQASFLTCSALEDLAAKLKMDPIELFKKNLALTARADTYMRQLDKAAELSEWKKNWKPRGQNGPGPVKEGLGIAIATWGGGGHASRCLTTINPDGTVLVELGSQDLGTGTRTVITQVAAETLGLPMSAITLRIGDNSLPVSGASGGSTTVGGVSSSTRKSTVNALAKLFETAAPALGVEPAQLEAVDGRVQVKGNAAKSLTWQAACSKLGVNKISEIGINDQRKPEGLNSSGVGGIQIAHVSVDTETGLVKMKRFVAVQDIGLVVNPKLADSQVHGAVIMGVCGALFEERVMDRQTGRMLNPDMEFYKLAGIGDVGEIISHLDITPENDKRGVIGLGEPCAVGVVAAIANAVANAIGVRVPSVPLSPDKVLAALNGNPDRRMA